MSFFSKTLNKIFGFRVQILWVITIILSFYFIYFSVKNASQPTHGFASYYTASNLLIEGENVADFYDDEVDAAVDAMTALLEPFMMVFLGGACGGILIAMYLPIFSMAGAVG